MKIILFLYLFYFKKIELVSKMDKEEIELEIKVIVARMGDELYSTLVFKEGKVVSRYALGLALIELEKAKDMIMEIEYNIPPLVSTEKGESKDGF